MRKQCFEKEYEGLLLFGFVFFGCASRGLKRLPQQQGAGEGTAPAEEGQQPVQQNSLACYHSVQNNLWLWESSEPSKLILLFQWNCFSFNMSRLSLSLAAVFHTAFTLFSLRTPCPPIHGSKLLLRLIGIRSSKARSWKSQLSLTPEYWRVLLLVCVILHGPLQAHLPLRANFNAVFNPSSLAPCLAPSTRGNVSPI